MSTTPPVAPPRARTSPGRKRHAPSFVRTPMSMVEAGPRWPGIAIIAGLGLLLALQLVLAQRAELATSAKWRPLVGGLCTVFRCTLPAWHEPTAFTMLNRSVQPKRGHPGVLTVSASFRNDAQWPQRWPTLLLSLSDMDGRQVGQRAFAPDDYRNPADAAATLAPGQSASVQLDVVEPAPRIVAFTFDFR